MVETVRARAHPLFDRGSFYRLGCELSVWSDGGAGSVQRFFEALRLQQLEDDWLAATAMELQDPALWDFGYDEETNRRIHRQRLRLPAQPPWVPSVGSADAESSRTAMAAGVVDAFELPALLRYDLRVMSPARPARIEQSPPYLFTGLDPSDRTERPRIQEFEVNVPVGADANGCSCLVLLLTKGLVEQLAGLMDLAQNPKPKRSSLPRRKINTQEAVIDAVTWALDARNLEPADNASEETLWRASRLAIVLGTAPALAGQVQGGRFQQFVPLTDNPQRTFPHLPGATWLVLCPGEEGA